MPAATVVVMAKAPTPGAVKTRLQPLLGAAGCARLQVVLIQQVVAVARALAPGQTWVAVDPPAGMEAVAALAPGAGVLCQARGDLGQRMAAAAKEVHARGPGPVLVVGTDIPTLSPEILTTAAAMLDADHDVVFGPAVDGGYYLVGMTRPRPELFALPPELWGGPGVLAASLDAAARTRLRVGMLPELSDLDTPADAAALLADPASPRDIAALLEAGRRR